MSRRVVLGMRCIGLGRVLSHQNQADLTYKGGCANHQPWCIFVALYPSHSRVYSVDDNKSIPRTQITYPHQLTPTSRASCVLRFEEHTADQLLTRGRRTLMCFTYRIHDKPGVAIALFLAGLFGLSFLPQLIHIPKTEEWPTDTEAPYLAPFFLHIIVDGHAHIFHVFNDALWYPWAPY